MVRPCLDELFCSDEKSGSAQNGWRLLSETQKSRIEKRGRLQTVVPTVIRREKWRSHRSSFQLTLPRSLHTRTQGTWLPPQSPGGQLPISLSCFLTDKTDNTRGYYGYF